MPDTNPVRTPHSPRATVVSLETTKAKIRTKRGPKTEEGKKRSSLNALKHGLTAKSPQAIEKISQECGADLQSIRERIWSHYKPRDTFEEDLVNRIARCFWRLEMASSMEERMFLRNQSLSRPGTTYERIMRFERLVDIHLHRAIAALQSKRESENNQNA